MIIIGIDPGTATTGFGVIQVKSSRPPCFATRSGQAKLKVKSLLRCLDWGVIQTSPNLSPEQRLRKLELGLLGLLRKYKPKVLAVEKLFFFKNLKTAMPVSEAKGVILLTAAKKKIKVAQLSPLEVKTGICGYGRADKKQVQRMLREILCLREIPKPDDAADALATAVCYAVKKSPKNT